MELNVSFWDCFSAFVGNLLLFLTKRKKKKKNPVSDGKFWDHESLLYERDTLDSIWHWIVIPCYYDNININTYREEKLWEIIRWSPEGKYFDLLKTSLNLFLREMKGGQFREFTSRSWRVEKDAYLNLETERKSIGPFIRGKIRRVLNMTRTVPFIQACLI